MGHQQGVAPVSQAARATSYRQREEEAAPERNGGEDARRKEGRGHAGSGGDDTVGRTAELERAGEGSLEVAESTGEPGMPRMEKFLFDKEKVGWPVRAVPDLVSQARAQLNPFIQPIRYSPSCRCVLSFQLDFLVKELELIGTLSTDGDTLPLSKVFFNPELRGSMWNEVAGISAYGLSQTAPSTEQGTDVCPPAFGMHFVQPMMEKVKALTGRNTYYPLTVQFLRYLKGHRRGKHYDPPGYEVIVGLTLSGSCVISLYDGRRVVKRSRFSAREYYVMRDDEVHPLQHEVSGPDEARDCLVLRLVDVEPISKIINDFTDRELAAKRATLAAGGGRPHTRSSDPTKHYRR